MGQIDQAKASKSAKRQSARDDARDARQRARSLRRAVDIQQIDGTVLLECLTAVVRIEGALRVGVSRDGGAFAFGIYGDGDPYTEYVGSDEDVNDYLRNLREYLDSLAD